MILIIILLIILILLVCIIFAGFYIKAKITNFTKEYFGTTDLKEAINKSEIEYSETRKSLSNMEPMYKSYIARDFPELNLNEMKAMVERALSSYFNSIEAKDANLFYYDNMTIKENIKKIVEDHREKNVVFDNIKYHNTVVNKYEKKHGIATLCFQTALEYVTKTDKGINKKIQTRFNTEFIYIIDANEVVEEQKSLGLNCPNCGAPITSLGNKSCSYCGSGVKEIVKRSWVINNIEEK